MGARDRHAPAERTRARGSKSKPQTAKGTPNGLAALGTSRTQVQACGTRWPPRCVPLLGTAEARHPQSEHPGRLARRRWLAAAITARGSSAPSLGGSGGQSLPCAGEGGRERCRTSVGRQSSGAARRCHQPHPHPTPDPGGTGPRTLTVPLDRASPAPGGRAPIVWPPGKGVSPAPRAGL